MTGTSPARIAQKTCDRSPRQAGPDNQIASAMQAARKNLSDDLASIATRTGERQRIDRRFLFSHGESNEARFQFIAHVEKEKYLIELSGGGQDFVMRMLRNKSIWGLPFPTQTKKPFSCDDVAFAIFQRQTRTGSTGSLIPFFSNFSTAIKIWPAYCS